MTETTDNGNVIQGFDDRDQAAQIADQWTPVSDRKIRMGIAGYGLCHFGAGFSLQRHPNVDVVAATDLDPDRCAGLAEACACDTTYPSLEEMVKDNAVEAVFVATDAPNHAQHCLQALNHGKHVATAVPAVFGNAGLEDADKLVEAVKRTGLNYMMFETSYYRPDLYAMRTIYEAGGFGALVYSEGQYFHYMPTPLGSYLDWRVGLPPQWYPTHSNAYYVGVTGGTFTDVVCMAMPSILPDFQPGSNGHNNIFDSEIALFRTSEGGMSRMAVAWGTAGAGTESGCVRGQRGAYIDNKYQGLEEHLPDLQKPPLPPDVDSGGHGGSHGYLGNEFVTSILQERAPAIDVYMSLNMTVPGIIAHQSACKDGERLKIPQYAR